MLPYIKRVNFILFGQGDIAQIILRLSIISYSLPDSTDLFSMQAQFNSLVY